ncbi:MAG TPA: APC family permease [Micromonosporaceae bacterium]
MLVGRPLRSERLGDTLLPKKLALPVFCSDPLSSNAYATEEILRAFSLGGLALFFLTPWVAGAVIALLAIVVISYRKTCYAYPSGGGAYAVSRANLGTNAALVAASALLVDYVLTVAVSVAAGVDAITSAFLATEPYAVVISLGLVVVLAVMNLRGVKESGTVFAVPTYGFIAVIFVMIGWGAVRFAAGDAPTAESAGFEITPQVQAAGALTVFLALRAFAQGCTALTGVEAVSNGVPHFKPPKDRNAADTLTVMGAITIAMFAGITILAIATRVRFAEHPEHLVGVPAGYQQRTAIAQVAGAVFGYDGGFFFLVQGFTAAILILAANTAFNGFPILASILGNDGYLPRQFGRRGDRLAFSNGIVILALLAGGLIWAFDASTSRLIQLYIIGVFVSFTLSQAGMVVHWTRVLHVEQDPRARRGLHGNRVVNAVGAGVTGVVLVIVLVTKFLNGAYLVVIAMPLVFFLMKAIGRHYRRVAEELEPEPGGVLLPSRVHTVVLVSKLHKPTLRALAYARATRPDTLTALTVATSPEEVPGLQAEWAERGIPVSLTVLESPYRDVTAPVLEYIASVRRASPRDLVVVYIPEYVVGRWWEQLLHNQSALRLKARLLFERGVMVTNVPWQLASSRAAEYRARPAATAAQPVATEAAEAGRITGE